MAITNLYVNVNASSVAQGLVSSLTNMTPVGLPEFVLGDTKQYDLYFVDGLGNYAAFSGSSSYTPYLAFGGCGQPTGGTFTLSFGGYTTSALAWNAPLATVQSALQGLTSIGAGNVLVTGTPGVYYVLQFSGSLANQPIAQVTGSSALLTPASNLDISITIPGTTSPAVSCQQVVFLALNPLVMVSNWTPITNGWTGTLTANTVSLIASFIGNGQSLTDTFQITVQDPSSNMATYVQIGAQAVCSIVNLHAFAAAVNPSFVTAAQLAAAVLGYQNWTRQDLTATSAGNTNVIPQTTSRNHSAVINFSGASTGTYTVSIENGNSPQYGDQVFLTLTGAPTGLTINIYNGSTSGTQIGSFVTDASGRPYTYRIGWNNTAWETDGCDAYLMDKRQNLAGLSSTISAKANLKDLFANIQTKSAAYNLATSDEGSLLSCSAASGAYAITLGAASGYSSGFLVAIQKTDSSANAITTSPSTVSITQQWQLVILQSNGTSWTVLINAGIAAGSSGSQQSTLSLTGITSLTGGGSTNLDGMATANGATKTNTIVEFVYSAGPQLVVRYRLRAGTDAAAAMFIVRPVDFNASTNAVVWELLSVSKQTWPCAYNATQSGFQQLFVSGAIGAEVVSVGPVFTFS